MTVTPCEEEVAPGSEDSGSPGSGRAEGSICVSRWSRAIGPGEEKGDGGASVVVQRLKREDLSKR